MTMAINYLLKLKGYVGGYDFDADYVDWKLSQHKGKPADVLIDSLGGSVATALSIVRSFKDHGDVTVHYAGMNASAATIVSMGAKRVLIDKNAMYLVHKASSRIIEFSMLNADQLAERIKAMEKEKANLMKIDLNIASMYADRCRKDRDSLLSLMKEGGWLTAQEALAWGFVDEIEDSGSSESIKISNELAASMTAAGIPLPKCAVGTTLKDRILSFFGTHNNNIMKKIYQNVCNVLKIETIAVASDGTAMVTEAQLQALEEAIADKDSTIADLARQNEALTARIADLEKAPGDTTGQVSASSKGAADDADEQLTAYRTRLREARELLKSI